SRVDNRSNQKWTARQVHVESPAQDRTDAKQAEGDGRPRWENPSSEGPRRQIVETEPAQDEGRHHCAFTRHDPRKWPVQVVVKEVAVDGIPAAPELGERRCAE